MKGIAGRAGLTCRVYPHKLRKTLGMDLKNKGVDIGTIQEVMGHASPADGPVLCAVHAGNPAFREEACGVTGHAWHGWPE